MTSPAPLTVCMIVRDEPRLEECLRSFRDHVEKLVIVDTGSQDRTPTVAARYADLFEQTWIFNDAENRLRSFADARNRSFELGRTTRTPWLMWVDGDDYVESADRLNDIIDQAEQTRQNQPAYVALPYEYEYDATRACTCALTLPRIVTRDGFHWERSIHEVLAPSVTAVRFDSDLVRVLHRFRTSKTVEAGRNLRILRTVVQEGSRDPRDLYYYGAELALNGYTREAIDVLEGLLEKRVPRELEAQACLKLARLYESVRDPLTDRPSWDRALHWAKRASDVYAGWDETWLAQARIVLTQAQADMGDSDQQYRRCLNLIQQGLDCQQPPVYVVRDPSARKRDAFFYRSQALLALGETDQAFAATQEGLAAGPDPRLQHVQKMVDRRPPNPILQVMQNVTAKSRLASGSNRLTISFFVGESMEPWNPRTAAAGIGGSEIACMEVARRLADRGHNVTVFGDVERPGLDLSGIFEGVKYQPYYEIKGDRPDILVSSRRADVFRWPVRPRVHYCWVHDTRIMGYQGDAFDAYLCVSDWQARQIGAHYGIRDQKIRRTRNGIDPDRFRRPAEHDRDPLRVLYSSSPDRGLNKLLDMWPAIIERSPGAELRIFYGLQGLDAVAPEEAERLRRQIAATPSVNFVGRVSQERLAAEMLSAGVWAYPTSFTETSCISAIEAQAAGLTVVHTGVAALAETVKFGVNVPAGPRFVDAVVMAMRTPEHLRDQAQTWALSHYDWEHVVDEWLQMIANDIRSKHDRIERTAPTEV